MTILESLDKITLYISQSFIVGIALLTIIDYLRHRDQARLDVALMFSSLGIAFFFGLIDTIWEELENEVLGILPFVFFTAQPYLLLRLVTHFREVSKVGTRIAFWGMVISLVSLTTMATIGFEGNTPLVLPAMLVAFISFVVTEIYAAVLFAREVRTSTGLLRYRLRYVMLGTILMSSLFLLFIISIILSALFDFEPALIASMFSLILMGMAISYYLGFAPPNSLRRLWQLTELHQFLGAMKQNRLGGDMTMVVSLLAAAGSRAVGGSGSTVALQKAGSLYLQSGERLDKKDDAIAQALKSGQPILLKDIEGLGYNGRLLLKSGHAEAIFIIPIKLFNKPFGLLFVLLPHGSLFPEDDMRLLTLFTEQSAVTFSYSAILDQQKSLNTQLQSSHNLLEARVAKRTKALEQTNQELSKAKADADLLSQKQASFLSEMTHELRTPLNAITSLTELVANEKHGPINQEQALMLQQILENSKFLASFINDTLDQHNSESEGSL